MLNDAVFRGLRPGSSAFVMFFDLGHEDTSKTTKSLLFMSTTHSYLLFDHSQNTPPTPAQEGACSTKLP